MFGWYRGLKLGTFVGESSKRRRASPAGERGAAGERLHFIEFARRWSSRPGDCPVTETVSDRLVCLPFLTSMKEEQQSSVSEHVTRW